MPEIFFSIESVDLTHMYAKACIDTLDRFHEISPNGYKMQSHSERTTLADWEEYVPFKMFHSGGKRCVNNNLKHKTVKITCTVGTTVNSSVRWIATT